MSPVSLMYLLTDANILIDLAQANALYLLQLVTRTGIATVTIPYCVYEEARLEITEAQILELGISMIHVPMEITIKAVTMDEKGLSDTDKTLLLLAMKHRYALWMNDAALHKKCKAYDVSAYWEFEVLQKLYKAQHITADVLLALADTLETINPRMKGIRERLSKDL